MKKALLASIWAMGMATAQQGVLQSTAKEPLVLTNGYQAIPGTAITPKLSGKFLVFYSAQVNLTAPDRTALVALTVNGGVVDTATFTAPTTAAAPGAGTTISKFLILNLGAGATIAIEGVKGHTLPQDAATPTIGISTLSGGKIVAIQIGFVD